MEHAEWENYYTDDSDHWYRQMENEAERYLLELQEREKAMKKAQEKANETTNDRRI